MAKEGHMKVFIAGANGRVGRKLADILNAEGHVVYAGTRHTEDISEQEGVRAVSLDLHEDVSSIAQALGDAEALYFVAGSRGKDLLQTDLYGAVKVMQAAEQRGIKRFIHLSSLFALEPERWAEILPQSMMNYYIAKFFSDSWLIDNTDLDYTIVQPGVLQETPGSGMIDVNVISSGGNSIENVAAVLAEVLEKQNTFKKVIKMADGDTPLKIAVSSV